MLGINQCLPSRGFLLLPLHYFFVMLVYLGLKHVLQVFIKHLVPIELVLPMTLPGHVLRAVLQSITALCGLESERHLSLAFLREVIQGHKVEVRRLDRL